jgi:hypothetical protein
MVIYKDANLDPEPDPLKKTVNFRDIGLAEQRLVGVQYLDWNAWNMNTGFAVEDNTHWIYNGTGLNTGDVIPGIIGYEIDSQFSGYLLPDSVSYTVLGQSPYAGNIHGPVLADTVIYETSLGSHVFASGSISWSWGLNRLGYIDQNLRTMMKNLLDRFVGPRPVPTAPAVTNPGPRNSLVGNAVSLAVTASDPQRDTLVFTADGLPAGLGIASNTGVISGTVVAAGLGSHTVSVHVTDGTQTTTVNFIWLVTASLELANCGAPTYNQNTDHNLYLWKECGTDNWHARLTSGGTSFITFSGTIESTTGFISVTKVNLESSDTVDTSNPNAIQFSFGAGNGGTDEVVFVPQIGTQMCFRRSQATTTEVRVGHGATPTVPPFDPTTSQGCYPLPNTAPLVTNPGDQSATEGDVVSLNISASDAEGNTLTYTAGGLPPGLGISASTGVISGTVAQGSAGAYNASVYVNDGALTTTVSFTWTVSSPPPPNTAPQVTNPGDQSATEGDVVSLDIVANDAEGNSLNYIADGLPLGLNIDAGTGVISGTVAPGSAGVYNTSVYVNDAALMTTVSFTWTVYAPNTAPQVTNPNDQGSTEGDVISLPISASDNEGNTLGYTADGLPPGLAIDPDTGVIGGTVAAGSAGAYNASVHVSDGSLTTTINFTWTVNLPNTAPQVTNPHDQTSTEGDVISLGIEASDTGSNPLSYSADGLPPGLAIDPDTGVIGGTVAAGSAGAHNASVHVYDGSLTTTVSFTWTVSSPPPSNPPDGDINDDGLVNVVDILLAQRALLGEITLTTDQMVHADVAPLQNGIPAPDGQFDLGDLLAIERKVLGLTSF